MTVPAPRPRPDTCTCSRPWAELITVIEGRRLAARPAEKLGPAAALFQARCASCGATYPDPWRLVRGQSPAA
ncbi:hypothetical protein [Streptomyces sp. NPDC059802]|uniref:hypothetical protein n=1 Tax=Streptomyces sp. NPDC059802 TaxID=3346952 RepID=UPI0036541DD5